MQKFTNLFRSNQKIGENLFKVYQSQNLEDLSQALKNIPSAQNFVGCKQEGLTLLHHAVFDENYPVVELMKNQLKYFRDIMENDDNEEGWTPLTFAGQKANLDIAKLLIEQGASPLIPKGNGQTVYHFAAANNDLTMMDYMINLSRHYSIDIKNAEGKTPASLASYFGHMDCINLLVENGADLRVMDSQEMSCYDIMIMNDHVDLMDIFYPKMVAADKERLGPYGMIHVAAGSKVGSKGLKYLLEKSDVSSMLDRLDDMKNKAQPILWAAIADNEINCKLLLKQMASDKLRKLAVNSQDEQGNTSLHMAAIIGSIKVAKVLENAGGDITIKNNHQETPLDMARNNKCDEIVEYFENKQGPSSPKKAKKKPIDDSEFLSDN